VYPASCPPETKIDQSFSNSITDSRQRRYTKAARIANAAATVSNVGCE